MRLTAKQEAFATAYVKSTNATEAYRLAYAPKRLKGNHVCVEAHRVLKNPKVARRIDELRAPALQANEMTVERTIRETACVSFSDPAELFDDDGNLIPIHKLPRHIRAAIASFKLDKDTGQVTEIKLWDKNSGLDKSMKHLGLFERHNQQKPAALAFEVTFVKAKPIEEMTLEHEPR